MSKRPPEFHLRALQERRLSWDETWLHMADVFSLRSQCTRAKVGAIIVDETNRVVSVGYNGPPQLMNCTGPCTEWCPRAASGATSADYSSCPSIHAETNALLFADKSTMRDGTMYISRSACADCARLIANTPIRRVVMRVVKEDAHRNPADVVLMMQRMGLQVAEVRQAGRPSPWPTQQNHYYPQFVSVHGYGPYNCVFCDESMSHLEVVHHVNGDHEDNRVENWAPAHDSCRKSHHATNASRRGWTHPDFVHERVRCPSCEFVSTPGPLALHRRAQAH